MNPPRRRAIAEWTLARTLLPVYSEIAPPELSPPCTVRDLRDGGDESMLRDLLAWFDDVDSRLRPPEFRHALRVAAGAELGSVLELVLERLIRRAPLNVE